jgi:hypothetical protein
VAVLMMNVGALVFRFGDVDEVVVMMEVDVSMARIYNVVEVEVVVVVEMEADAAARQDR